MKIKKSFGECLSSLLEVFNINGSKLAKGINIDQSLVYKWIRNERTPAYHSLYIDLITNYLTTNFNNLSHRKKIAEFFLHDKTKSMNNFDISSVIRNKLYEAQNYSLEQKKKNKLNKKREPVLNMSGQQDFCMSGNTDTITLIKGMQDVLNGVLTLLIKAPKAPDTDNTILVTLNSKAASLPDCEEFIIQWKKAIINVLNKGWKFTFLVRLNDNVKRTLEIVEVLQIAFNFDKFNIYYIKKMLDKEAEDELIIVPNTGALFGFSAYTRNHVDTGFLFHSKDSLEALKGHFFQLCASAKPLFKEYSRKNYFEFQKLLLEVEEQLGDRFVYNGQCAGSIPLSLYEKCLMKNLKKAAEIEQRSYLHSKRLDAFNTQINYYKFKDIWFKESIEKLVVDRQYAHDGTYFMEGYIPEKEDIYIYIENVIYLLQKHKNYEVAVISDSKYKEICKTCWMVKGHSYVLIDGINNNLDINLSVTEETVVAAYREFYLNMWDGIPKDNKDKERTIEWLKLLLELAI